MHVVQTNFTDNIRTVASQNEKLFTSSFAIISLSFLFDININAFVGNWHLIDEGNDSFRYVEYRRTNHLINCCRVSIPLGRLDGI